MGQNSQMERSISIGPVQPRKEVHLDRWTTFFETFPVDLTDPFSFRPKFPEILVEWIAPLFLRVNFMGQLFKQGLTSV